MSRRRHHFARVGAEPSSIWPGLTIGDIVRLDTMQKAVALHGARDYRQPYLEARRLEFTVWLLSRGRLSELVAEQ